MKKLLLSFVAALLLATGEGTGTTYAVDTCDVADPTGTPLNVRNQPNGKILFTLRNGTKVVWVELSNDQKWVKIFPMTGRHRDREGWVFTDFLDCGYSIKEKMRQATEPAVNAPPELNLHHGNNDGAMLLLEKADGQRYATMIEIQESCLSILETIEARTKNGLETWLNWAEGKPERILQVFCFGAPK